MKKFTIVILFIFGWNVHSQIVDFEIIAPNRMSAVHAFFYKDSWKPFTGNVLVETDYKNRKLPCRIKYQNGFETLSELFDPKTKEILLQGKSQNIANSESVYDSINVKTAFEKHAKFTDVSNLKDVIVSNYFIENKERTVAARVNGFVKSGQTKTYFANGMKVRIDYFYDADLKKIRESYGIFRTEIGNIDPHNQPGLTYDGNYQKWDQNGNIAETGTYKEGKKCDSKE